MPEGGNIPPGNSRQSAPAPQRIGVAIGRLFDVGMTLDNLAEVADRLEELATEMEDRAVDEAGR